MPHLDVFRRGWENEHLATYLLSRIAFVANPITVADDIGSDFICTLIERREVNARGQLFPLRSFAIQVKSSADRISGNNKIEYLSRLELPYFVGVIDRNDLSLSVYSGEFLPMMFSHVGRPNQLALLPVETEDLTVGEAYSTDPTSVEVKFPFLVRLRADDDVEQCEQNTETLDGRCFRMHHNLSTRTNKEHIYRLDDAGGVLIMAGPGSAETFRSNLHLRLAEAFYNLEWLLQSQPDQSLQREFEAYALLYEALETMGQELPTILNDKYETLKARLDRQDLGTTQDESQSGRDTH